ncbi:2-hydroxychromene-2-carboxylate isomerase [Bradyrhizobium sp. Cp5.3]|uniref:2-hydroxychromene-2-carboxylate isomerase n=1 Tax=Bradyrhizobium sp. Cp5.3 TaxID=443598 RepID=UPI0004288841|nr:DsbA family protein [Bradyrhizobium sp. Cp5.3]
MAATIDVYYDFRSPYAYFAAHRIRDREIAGHSWRWCPVSIDVLLNLQAGREPFAPYSDPLSAPKRAHLIADVRRLAAYHDLPLRPPRPARPNSVPALCLAALIDESARAAFTMSVFDALWRDRQDIADPEVLAACLTRTAASGDLVSRAFTAPARLRLAEQTKEAYARGIFGVPSFAVGTDIFFGNDRLDLLRWTLERQIRSAS